MSEVVISFSPEMADAVFNRNKRCTARRTQKGTIADTFFVNGWEFEIVAVARVPLWFVADVLYAAEGFHTPAEVYAFFAGLGVEDKETPLFVHKFSPVKYPVKGGRA